MKTKTTLAMLYFLWILVGTGYAETLEIPPPAILSGPKFHVKETVAEVFSDNTILVVRGKVENVSYKRVKGYVIIYLRSSNNDVLGTVETPVNNNNHFHHGSTGNFEVSANIKDVPEIVNVTVEFVQQ
ncbi:MAG: hypothetical protein KAR13_09520 [Desulfobulbaceae bacterium]|nr:hypothetical protein [Desulfobulbaceae bacterium]MCK5323629.1 hypothetical protein [Desulfobulbaceae bacterium]MCK5436912.1 hypothetical protein [Desulfobulbaceae bacterium]